MNTRHILGLIGWLALCFAAAAVGAVASSESALFYGQLDLPGWAPPAWLFGPVWTILYILMGISAWLVWRVNGFYPAGKALTLFIVQLAANAVWTWIFFVWKQGSLAFFEIIFLWGLLIATMIAFRRIKPIAAVLLLPYFIWVSFASVLTYTVWKLNPLLLA